MTMTTFSRRSVLAGVAAIPLGATTGLPAMAAAHIAPTNAIHRSFSIGEMQCSTLISGARTITDDPQGIFGMNIDKAEFEAVSAANFIPADKVRLYFQPTVVRTGGETVLIDTGPSAEGTLTALEAAGVSADDISVVVITHMHGDHIGGLTDELNEPTFVNARYVTGQVEYDHWAAAGNEGFDAKVRPLADKFTFIGDGDAAVSGITAVSSFGHTPGHMCYMLEDGGAQLMLMGDLTNHHVWSLAYPDWEVRFDMDKGGAAASRKKILGMAAADRFMVAGYHLAFPGIGYVTTEGAGDFHFVPESYQLSL